VTTTSERARGFGKLMSIRTQGVECHRWIVRFFCSDDRVHHSDHPYVPQPSQALLEHGSSKIPAPVSFRWLGISCEQLRRSGGEGEKSRTAVLQRVLQTPWRPSPIPRATPKARRKAGVQSSSSLPKTRPHKTPKFFAYQKTRNSIKPAKMRRKRH